MLPQKVHVQSICKFELAPGADAGIIPCQDTVLLIQTHRARTHTATTPECSVSLLVWMDILAGVIGLPLTVLTEMPVVWETSVF